MGHEQNEGELDLLQPGSEVKNTEVCLWVGEVGDIRELQDARGAVGKHRDIHLHTHQKPDTTHTLA